MKVAHFRDFDQAINEVIARKGSQRTTLPYDLLPKIYTHTAKTHSANIEYAFNQNKLSNHNEKCGKKHLM